MQHLNVQTKTLVLLAALFESDVRFRLLKCPKEAANIADEFTPQDVAKKCFEAADLPRGFKCL